MKKTGIMVVLTLLLAGVIFAQQDPNTPPAKAKAVDPIIKIATTKGEIVVELYADKAPITVENFLKYTKEGFYNGTIFHRVWKGFMIQGGGFTPNLMKKNTQKAIKNEAANGLKNKRGTIAMARTPVPDSATSQFFINHVNNPALDYRNPSPRGIGYAVFGKVIKGMEVVDAIANVKVKKINERFQHLPVDPVVIESVTLVESKCTGEKTCEKSGQKCSGKENGSKDCCKKKSCLGTDKKCDKKDGECCGKDGKCCKSSEEQCKDKKESCSKAGGKCCKKEKQEN